MEQKKVNLSLLFSLIAFALGIAIKGVASYFGGNFGIPFVAVATMILLAMFFAFANKENRKRLTDVLVLNVVVSVLWLIVFCAYDWAMDITADLVDFAQVLMNVISVLSLIFAGWTIFRLFCELAGKKVKFVEVLLGNEKVERKPKEKKQPKEKPVKNLKEVENGDLLDKPSRDVEISPEQTTQATEPTTNTAQVENTNQVENADVEQADEPTEENKSNEVVELTENTTQTETTNQLENAEQESADQQDQTEARDTQNDSNPFNYGNFDRYIY